MTVTDTEPTAAEIDRVARKLADILWDSACKGNGYVGPEIYEYDDGMRLCVDGDVDLTVLAKAAIAAVRALS